MQGFLLNVNSGAGPLRPLTRIPPAEFCPAVRRESFGEQMSFFGWGSTPGDITLSRRHDDSILVLSGYVTHAGLPHHGSTQQEVSDSLLATLDQSPSHEDLATMARRFHGSFAIVYVCSGSRRVYCISDRVSSRPLWIARVASSWLLSSSPVCIARARGDVQYDLGALASFLLYGCPLEPRKSLFAGVRAVDEGTVQELATDGGVKQTRWYRYEHKPDKRMAIRDWVAEGARRLKASAARVLETCSRPMVFLSGGIDSRLTASALRAAGGRPMLVTLGDSRNLEIKVAERVARALDCPHEVMLRDPHWYLRSLRSAAYESGGSYVWTHGHFSEAYRRCRDTLGVDCALLGDLCEAFSKLCCSVQNNISDVWSVETFVEQCDELPLALYRPANRPRTLKLIHRGIRTEAEALLRADIEGRYRRLRDVSGEPAVIADSFFRWKCVPSMATFLMFLDTRSAGPERSLMVDKDVHELLETMPGAVREGTQLGARLVSELWPRAGRVVDTNTLLPMRFPRYVHTAVKRLRPVLGKLRRRLIEDSHRTTASWPKQDVLYRSDPQWNEQLERILRRESTNLSGILDGDEIARCWREFCRGDVTRTPDIERLVTLSVVSEVTSAST